MEKKVLLLFNIMICILLLASLAHASDWWDTYGSRREAINGTTSIMLLINGSHTYSDSDIDSNGTIEWLYYMCTGAGTPHVYYNPNDIGAVANSTTECSWCCTKGCNSIPDYGNMPDSTLDAFYPLDEASGTIGIDFSSNGNNVTRNNCGTVNAAGKIHRAWDFPGTSNCGLRDSDPTGISTENKSVSVWFYADDFNDRGDVVFDNIIFQYRNTGGPWYFLAAIDAEPGTLKAVIYNSDPDGILIESAAITKDVWYHLVLTWDASATNFTMWLNATQETSGVNVAVGTTDYNDEFTIGNWDGLNRGWNGLIDNFQTYDRVLTPTEINALWREGDYIGPEELQPLNIYQTAWIGRNTSHTNTNINTTWNTSIHAIWCNLDFNGTNYNQTNTSSPQITWWYQVTNLTDGNYSSINISCGNGIITNVSDSTWTNIDTTSPIITWDWPQLNSTITLTNSTTICVDTNELANCTLHFNDTDTPSAPTLHHCWDVLNLPNANYTNIYVDCEDLVHNPTQSTKAWLNVNYSPPPPTGPLESFLSSTGTGFGNLLNSIGPGLFYIIIILGLFYMITILFKIITANITQPIKLRRRK